MIFVIGSGLVDLHLNTWLHEARSHNSKTPLLFIDQWDGDFLHDTFEVDPKRIEMFHALNIYIRNPCDGVKVGTGWTNIEGSDSCRLGQGVSGVSRFAKRASAGAWAITV